MPTAARIFGAFCFAVIGFLGAEAVKPMMPEGTQFGYFSLVMAAIGAACGWSVMGGLVGRGYGVAISSGWRTSATLVFFGLLLFSGREMILRSIHRRYHGPVEALQGMVALATEYGRLLLNTQDLVILIGGGALAGLLVEWISRRWR